VYSRPMPCPTQGSHVRHRDLGGVHGSLLSERSSKFGLTFLEGGCVYCRANHPPRTRDTHCGRTNGPDLSLRAPPADGTLRVVSG
jgi:hypothetical protein